MIFITRLRHWRGPELTFSVFKWEATEWDFEDIFSLRFSWFAYWFRHSYIIDQFEAYALLQKKAWAKDPTILTSSAISAGRFTPSIWSQGIMQSYQNSLSVLSGLGGAGGGLGQAACNQQNTAAQILQQQQYANTALQNQLDYMNRQASLLNALIPDKDV